ncbi:sugar phosphate isomerase/epimerase family protein [Clostridium butyricum]|uniref:Sugar phosphate isomerase/epimerase n=1 Tax=Clostridium butyricum TaxID=1492 RepID=A0AAP9RDS8_CLOBU|nr:sugar phosphate isomerase/epimerase family protein [Clostridium butyricum]MBZ5745724.1 sugar phosphate isomerase/epimerase [Clostridium butyricum]MDB2151767.1 sugar phosphate isomerase/epimerase [Clostridium butyricum]MDI9210749.1 sugar phosphate isomerase/epimerase [Clostridium butyricum]QMW89736.1 sugar phosphate isomerase/epimerase [Clostridium butyricum]BBK78201.1 hypothetical protein Cbu04g_32090 [Clostridium butyricum]
MKLSISNIAWSKEYDYEMYEYLEKEKFEGLEIAPTRIFEERPYEDLDKAKLFSENLKKNQNLKVSSMQSIWYGRNEKIFGSKEERAKLIEYTKKAIDFANTIRCNNLVFGCPKNRVTNSKQDEEIALDFFYELGEYAEDKGTVLSMEPNPVIYNTNFINYTIEAFEFVKKVNSKGLKVNVDLGTIIYNKEDLNVISDNINLVNHVHISEPNLALIQKRDLHIKLASILKEKEYNNYVSIEMGKCDSLHEVKESIKYINEVFK